MVDQNTIIPTFTARAKYYLSDALTYFTQAVTDFLLSSPEDTTMNHFSHFNDHNSWSIQVNETNDPTFLICF